MTGKISEMSPAGPLDGTELLEVVQSDGNGGLGNKKLELGRLFTLAKSAYDIAVQNGFVGTEQEWLDSLTGKSVYQLAVEAGFTGTETEYLQSLVGAEGKSAYDLAVENGYTGTVTEWTAHLNDAISLPIGEAGQIVMSDGSGYYWVTLDKYAVGLSNVDNTSDLDKPISIATQLALDAKLNIADLETEVNKLTFDLGTY